MELEELMKKYPLSQAEESPVDLRDYDITMLVASSSKKSYPDIIKDVDYPILDQGSISSCVANAISVMGSYLKNVQPTLDEMFSVGWIYGYREDTDSQREGMVPREAFKMATKTGLVKHKDFPFNLRYQECKAKINEYGVESLKEKASKYKLDSYMSLYDEDDVKEFLNEVDNGLVGIMVRCYENFYDSLTNGGEFPSEGTGKKIGNHEMVIKGVKDHKYILINSWNKDKGNNGIFTIDVDSPTIIEMRAFIDKRLIREPQIITYTVGWNKFIVNNQVKWGYSNDGKTLLKTSWIKPNNKWYYIGDDNYCYDNQWLLYKGDYYFLQKDSCEMATNCWVDWRSRDGHWYWVKADGVMAKSEWITYNNNKYYLSESGAMVTGTQNIDHKFYEFDASGALIKIY